MLADFCLRLSCGMVACLLLLSPLASARAKRQPLANPNFFRTQFLTVVGLTCLALLFLRDSADAWYLALLGVAVGVACLGSVTWSLEGSPGGLSAIVVAFAALLAAIVWRESAGGWQTVVGALSAAALLGAAVSAMLMGHNYLVAPSMALTPLYRLLAALAIALGLRMAVDGYALGCWTREHSLATLTADATLWLPVRWGVGLVAPLGLCWMAWQTARIRSTQSATGILYVVVIFCFLGELTGQLLRRDGVTL